MPNNLNLFLGQIKKGFHIMLTAREAAEITKSTSVTDKQRAQIIWDNQIEDRIKGQAGHGYNELTR